MPLCGALVIGIGLLAVQRHRIAAGGPGEDIRPLLFEEGHGREREKPLEELRKMG